MHSCPNAPRCPPHPSALARARAKRKQEAWRTASRRTCGFPQSGPEGCVCYALLFYVCHLIVVICIALFLYICLAGPEGSMISASLSTPRCFRRSDPQPKPFPRVPSSFPRAPRASRPSFRFLTTRCHLSTIHLAVFMLVRTS